MTTTVFSVLSGPLFRACHLLLMCVNVTRHIIYWDSDATVKLDQLISVFLTRDAATKNDIVVLSPSVTNSWTCCATYISHSVLAHDFKFFSANQDATVRTVRVRYFLPYVDLIIWRK